MLHALIHLYADNATDGKGSLTVQITVIGCGHLGATHAACMAAIGHEVVGVDIDEGKIRLLNSGRAWFHEPGLDEMLAEHVRSGRLRFTTSFAEAGAFADAHFIGVATPGLPDGSYDLSQLRAALLALAPHLGGDALVIGKSTVPPGTAVGMQATLDRLRPRREHGWHAEVAWNPEFLREACAVADTLRPDRIVVGVASNRAAEIVREIYRPITQAGIPLVVTDLATAELVKGAANAFLATKISFINAMADICATTGGDAGALARSLGLDPRIGPACLRAGTGYGGACLPKDVRGLGAFARSIGARHAASLLTVVDAINSARACQVLDLVRAAAGEIAGQRIAVWGAAFKPGTDDVRDSTALKIADGLREHGAQVTVYDPMASGNALVAVPELRYADSALAAVAGAHALVVVTPWPEFARAAPAEAAALAGRAIVVDACQGIDLPSWQAAGWQTASLVGTPYATTVPSHFVP
jgi:UDPglucose 6-dehydrogenase